MNISELNVMAINSIHEAWGCGIVGLGNSSEAAAPYYRFLHKVVATYKPQAVLECGVYLGVASAHMAVANPGTMVIGIDIDLRPNARKYSDSYANVHYCIADTTSSLAYDFIKAALGDRKLGILFLDSEHNGVTPSLEYANYKEFFDRECLVVCDDIIDKRMEEFWVMLPGEKVTAHFLHPSPYNGIPEPGFGYSIVRTNYA